MSAGGFGRRTGHGGAIRVQIVASSATVRAELESLLEDYPSLHILGGLYNEDESADDAIADVRPDVVLAELESREDEATFAALNAAASGASVVLLVPGLVSEWANMLQQGVKAVLPASAAGPQIVAAAQAVAAGLVVLYPSETESFLRTQRTHDAPDTLPDALPEPLTPREIEVLGLVAEGLGNKEIASRLGVSEHTVKFHVASIMGKLGAASRTEAVTIGIRHGIVLI